MVKSAVESELAEGTLASLPVKGYRLILDIYIGRLRDYELPLAARRFHEYLLTVKQTKDLPVGITDFKRHLGSLSGKVENQR